MTRTYLTPTQLAPYLTPALAAHIRDVVKRKPCVRVEALICQHYPPSTLGIPRGWLSAVVRTAVQAMIERGELTDKPGGALCLTLRPR